MSKYKKFLELYERFLALLLLFPLKREGVKSKFQISKFLSSVALMVGLGLTLLLLSAAPAAGKNLVMVVGDAVTLSTSDQNKKTEFESWGWTVTAIDDDAVQATYDNAAANNDVMYISESSASSSVGTKATLLDIGIVNEENYTWDQMRFTATADQDLTHTTINISNNSHYITSVFSTGNLMIYGSADGIGNMVAGLASGGQLLATENNTGSAALFYFETGAALTTGTAPNRRVGIPTSYSTFTNWNADVKTIVQRSLEWAAGMTACGTNLVMVTQTGDFSSGYDSAKKALFEGWGWTVTAIEDLNGDYSGAASSNDVMFISESVTSSEVGTQATSLDIGIVLEEVALPDEMELSAAPHNHTTVGATQIDIVDNSHYITSSVSTGPLTIYSVSDNLQINHQAVAAGAFVLAEQVGGNDTVLIAIPTGATLDDGTGAANRRVGFWGMHASNPANWTSSMETLVQSSLNWAAGCGAGGGGGNTPPNVYAGADKNVTLPSTANLSDATADDGGDGPGPTTYTWTKQSGTGTVTFSPNDSVLNPTASFSTDDTYVLRLTVNDGTDSDWDEVQITVSPSGTVGTPIDASDVAGYSCNMKLTIDNTKVAFTSPQNFPVLIHVTDESLKTSGCGFVTDPDGDDIIFTDSDVTLQLNHEIERYDSTTGEIVAWVLVPSLSGSADTDIYMYYGDSNVTTFQADSTAVWDSDYVGVWHLHDDYLDSTSYDNDGSPNNMDPFAAGQVGNAGTFDGTDDYVVVAHDSELQMSNEITVSAWINPDDVWNWRTIVSKMSGTNSELYFVLEDQTMILKLNGPMSSDWWSSVSVYEDQWAYVAFTYSNTTDTVTMYRNAGADTDSISRSGTLNLSSNTNNLYIGANTGWPGEDFDGHIDEVRISRVARSAEWIQTSYNNQYNPSSFLKDKEVQCPNLAQPEDFSCSMELTVDNTMVSGSSDLTDFPVLISLTDDVLKGTGNCGFVANSNGYDIMFTDSNDNQLDHEIEKYEESTGELVAWVKKTISPTADDPQNIIRLYYGNNNVCGALENPNAVWDSNYKTVWHVNETSGGSGAIKDSTANANHGTDFNSPTFGANGKVGNAIDFDGTNDYATMPTSGFNTSAGTVELWANIDTFPSTDNKYMFSHLTPSPTANRVYVNLKPDNTWGTGMGDTYDLVRGSTVNADTWYHLVLTWDGANARGYRDGVLDFGPTSYTGLTTVGDIYIAAWDGTAEWFDGTVDEVRISDTVRSADWIKTSYNNQSDPASFYTITNHTCGVPEPSPNDFRCWRPITIDEQYVMGLDPLDNFPLLIRINSDPLLETSNPPTSCGKVKSSDGYDIIFTDEYGTEVLDHEVEVYNGGTGKLVAWVRIPSLSATSDTVIRMYYGDLTGQFTNCPTENPAGVWSYENSPYEAVYHLQYDVNDATSNARHGYNNSSDDDDGMIERSRDFNPSVPESFDMGTWSVDGQGLTLQAWVDFDTFGQDDPRVISKANGTSTHNHVFMLGLGDTGDGMPTNPNEHHPRFRVKTGFDDDTGGTTTLLASSYTINTSWHLLAGTYDGIDMRLLVDGQEVASTPKTGDLGVNSWKITVGNNPVGGSTSYSSMDGELDEIRILSTARSADWLRTEWYNQRGSVQFYTIGNDSCESEYTYRYCQKITVDHTKVSGSSHSNFPLLVKITQDDLKWVNKGGLVQNQYGYDIVFKDDSCNLLDHEVESYDKDTGALVAWVRIPTLSGSNDTEIYMFYGNPYIDCPTESPSDVWSSNYEAVYHLHDDFEDSTGQHNGTNFGATFATGHIGNGALFDPTEGGFDYIYIGDWSVSGDDMTIQAWAFPENFTQNDPRIISKANGSSEDNHVFMLSLNNGNNGENEMRLRMRTEYTVTPPAPASPYQEEDTVTLYGDNDGNLPAAQAWYSLVGVYDDGNSSGEEMIMYRDGIHAGDRAHHGVLDTKSWDIWIGANPVGSNNSSYSWHGVLDEIRILNVELRLTWIETEYNNQSDPSSFYSLGSCQPTTHVTSEWKEDF